MVAGFAFAPSVRAYDPDLLCAVADPVPRRLADDTLLMCPPPALAVDAPLVPADAQLAWTRARELAAAGRYNEAILSLRVVAEAEPRIADRVTLEEARYRMADGPTAAACRAFERAEESPHRSVALEAEIGLVRCRLTIGDRDGADGLARLQRRYPELTMEDELRFLLAGAHEGWGEPEDAGRLYRSIDLMSPGGAWAERSRVRIAALEGDGVHVRPLTPTQEVDRADRLVRTGPMDRARQEIARLRAAELPRALAQQVASSAARIARVEGRFDAAAELLREASGQVDLEPEERTAMTERAADFEAAAAGHEVDRARVRIRQLTRGRSIDRQPTARAFSVLRIASRAGLADVTDDALRSILGRDRMPPGLCLDAGLVAAGTGDDALVAELLGRAMASSRYAVPARYHHARTLERMGRIEDARAEYVQVVAEDSRRLPFYAMWSRSRLLVISAAAEVPEPLAISSAALECGRGPYTEVPEGMFGKVGEGRVSADLSSAISMAVEETGAASPSEVPEDELEVADLLAEADTVATTLEAEGDGGLAPDVDLSLAEVAAILEPLAEEHGEAFPWITRALVLVRIGESEAARAELHETYTAWRDASGAGSLRSGLAGVLRGGAPARHRVSGSTWRARRTFPSSARTSLARVAAALGEPGLSIRFGGSFAHTGARPRAYAGIVEAAAARHGVEPELLFAVMRVESVYNPRIISYAGAIGLMQIMPRTGRLIASALGRGEFTVDQLLDPEVNIDFAAWYLASLIERFDGRIPLAVASYNGGPHNVRRWMHSYSEELPLDAFLERIEFAQTHRYVRRVLTHYEAYRAQRGQPMVALDVTLPELGPDTVAF